MHASAQEDDFTQYYLNLPAVNPAFTGVDDFFSINAGVREGWNDYGIQNDNSYFSFFGALNTGSRSGRRNNSLRTSDPSLFEKIQNENKFRRRHGLGGIVTSRKVGPYKSFGSFLNYSYHLPLTSRLSASLGSRVGFTNQRIDFSGLQVRDDVNDLFYQSLLLAGQGTQNTLLMDFGMVVYSKRFFLGFSSDNLLARMMNGDGLFSLNSGVRYSAQVGAFLPLNAEWMISPGIFTTYKEGYDLRWAANLRLKYKDFIYVGSAYEPDLKTSLLFGLNTNRLSINYAYDMYMGGLDNFNITTHELILGITVYNPYKLKPRFW
ncbi:MAG: PorP/SprF family type IX secretion system membrane protein [Cyclobacteriaceae bacterium]|nr:PorP/SprF family type IX secretion system membrane protein [Cyclobacteriaceae bacterium]UYN85841.1 MAG: PorP/SprF family type IX secretion system membrane protein [Cyclobacteriaceae bacterium]